MGPNIMLTAVMMLVISAVTVKFFDGVTDSKPIVYIVALLTVSGTAGIFVGSLMTIWS